MIQASEEMQALNQPTLDFFILADRAEAVNGKVYMMGGGWDRLTVQDFNLPVAVSFALGILVPWNATNESHRLQVTIEDQDGRPVDFRLETEFVVGRPPLTSPGEIQRIALAVPSVSMRLPGPGSYTVRASINGVGARPVVFRALPVQVAPPLGQ
jgi:hypothetical protein